MKKVCYFLLAGLVLCCASIILNWEQEKTTITAYARMHNTAAKYMRDEIAPSVFGIWGAPIIVITPDSIKDPLEKIQKTSIYRCPHGFFSNGTGMAISEDGLILTAAHVTDVEEGFTYCLMTYEERLKEVGPTLPETYNMLSEYWLIDSAGKTHYATLVASDKEKDLSLLQVSNTTIKFKPLTISDETSFSDEAIAIIGMPIGRRDMITIGKIARPIPDLTDGQVYIAAPVYPGNSGGPVINMIDMTMIGLLDTGVAHGGSFTVFGGMITTDIIKEFLKDAVKKF